MWLSLFVRSFVRSILLGFFRSTMNDDIVKRENSACNRKIRLDNNNITLYHQRLPTLTGTKSLTGLFVAVKRRRIIQNNLYEIYQQQIERNISINQSIYLSIYLSILYHASAARIGTLFSIVGDNNETAVRFLCGRGHSHRRHALCTPR